MHDNIHMIQLQTEVSRTESMISQLQVSAPGVTSYALYYTMTQST